MMRAKTTLFIILIAFTSGFAVNEYRHQQTLSQQTIPQQPLENKNLPIPQVSLETNGSIAIIDLPEKIDTTRATSSQINSIESFSWEQVDQMIASAHYDDAIRLLQTQMGNAKNAARAWLTLALIYRKQSQPIAAIDAWFRYVRLEVDDQKINKTLGDIKNYLLQLKATPALFNDDYSWMMAQFDELLKYHANDGELHLILASVSLQLNDKYQAQYHALMAVNDPNVQDKAEIILAQLNGNNTPQEVTIPLVRYGNQYLINATIEGYPARLLLDTGASLSGVSNSFTAKYSSLVKATKPIRLNTASGTYDSFLFTVNNISIGNLVFNQHILTQLPMDNSEGFDGLLGIDILGRFDFVIDQNAAILRLKARK